MWQGGGTGMAKGKRREGKGKDNLPFVMAKSVMVCHRSIATRHPPSTRLQLRSMTNFSLSSSRASRTD